MGLSHDKQVVELEKTRMRTERICQQLRGWGLVIDPKNVGLEIATTSADLHALANALEAVKQINNFEKMRSA
jgi:hypothetical protein